MSLPLALTLADLRPGEKVKILGFNSGNEVYQQKLMSMGLVPETELEFIRVAPWGDPIEIKVHQIFLCIRQAESQILKLERILKPVKVG